MRVEGNDNGPIWFITPVLCQRFCKKLRNFLEVPDHDAQVINDRCHFLNNYTHIQRCFRDRLFFRLKVKGKKPTQHEMLQKPEIFYCTDSALTCYTKPHHIRLLLFVCKCVLYCCHRVTKISFTYQPPESFTHVQEFILNSTITSEMIVTIHEVVVEE
jgi:hypothetical protein